MASTLYAIVEALWIAWLIYWFVASRDVKEARWHESLPSQLLHRVPLVVAMILLAAPPWLAGSLMTRVLPRNRPLAIASALAVAIGLGFSAWARMHLGRNWSATVTVKESHTLICTGPYRYVRHPIYSGILLALLGTAAVSGEWRGFIAVGFALVAIAWKVSVEERRMLETFPEYARYRRETAALVPFVM